jgi:hypothetical protein
MVIMTTLEPDEPSGPVADALLGLGGSCRARRPLARRSRSVGWRASERMGAGAGRGDAPGPRERGVPPGIPEGSQQRCREGRRWAAPELSTADGPHCGLGSRVDRCLAWLPSTLLRASSRGGAPAKSLRSTSRAVKLRCARLRPRVFLATCCFSGIAVFSDSTVLRTFFHGTFGRTKAGPILDNWTHGLIVRPRAYVYQSRTSQHLG